MAIGDEPGHLSQAAVNLAALAGESLFAATVGPGLLEQRQHHRVTDAIAQYLELACSELTVDVFRQQPRLRVLQLQILQDVARFIDAAAVR